jgi:hypothetical protein
VFAALLDENDARRATKTAAAILAHGVRGALTGGLAIAAQLRVHGRPVERQELNDIDLVVEGLGAVPESMAASFLLHHVHPDAVEGKILLQLIDETTAVRVDLFRTVGNTLTRASALNEQAGALPVLSVEDLVARTTALVCGSLKRGATIDRKHAPAFIRLLGLGRQGSWPLRGTTIARRSPARSKRRRARPSGCWRLTRNCLCPGGIRESLHRANGAENRVRSGRVRPTGSSMHSVTGSRKVTRTAFIARNLLSNEDRDQSVN